MLLALPVVAAILFLPAGSLKFWQGWLFIASFLGGSLFLTLYFSRHDPGLLERRLQNKEREGKQRLFQILWIPLWIGALALPGLDYRFGWSRVPVWLELVSAGFVIYSYVLIFQVMRVNTFASAVIQVEAGQDVISHGPYRLVRHPMYTGFLVMAFAAPLSLGSYVALPVSALLIPLLVFRLIHEERTLQAELPGYVEYCRQTRFRLVPFVY